jgi:EmrB/QacA subfamily drug resistance transporter
MMKSSTNTKVLLIVLILGCFLSVLNQTLLNVALSDFMEIFHVSASTVQWLVTGFMLINGVLIPITAYLMKRFTTRQLFISAMLSLLIGSILCAIAPNFGVLLTGRMIQAICAGIILPLLMAVVMFVFPAEKRGSMMGMLGLAVIFAPAIAPPLAGFIMDYTSWRWLFIGIIPFVIIVIFLSFKYLINISEVERVKLDLTSVILSTIGFGAILYGFSTAGSQGWSDPLVIASLPIGFLIIVIFAMRQIKLDEPLLNLSVFKNRVFNLTTILNILITMMMYADLVLLPLFLQNGRGFTALEAGFLLLPGAIVNALMSPATGKLYDRLGAKPVFIIGLIFIIPSMWVVTNLTDLSYTFIMVRTIFLRIGFSFITMPLNTAGLNALPKHLVTHGTAINNTIRQIAGGIGTAVIITIFSTEAANRATELATSGVTENIKEQAITLGSGDAYYFMLILAILSLILTLFLPKMSLPKPKEEKTKETPKQEKLNDEPELV